MTTVIDNLTIPAQLKPIGERPSVSVIIPAYNAEKYVLQALHSVLAQTYQPMEILLIDDGSRDGTVDLVRAEAPQVKIISQPNAGVAAARNTGLRHATGELISFLDADDGWFPDKLETVISYLRHHPETGLVFHEWYDWKPDDTGEYPELVRADKTGLPETEARRTGWIYPVLLLKGCIVHTSSVTIRREVFEDIGFFKTGLVTGEDYDYWLRVSQKYQIHMLTAIYSFYRNTVPGSLSNTPKSENYEYNVLIAALDKWGLSSPGGTQVTKREVAGRLGKLAFEFGYAQYYYGSPRLAKQAFIKAWRHEPRRWRAYVYMIAAQLKDLTKTLSV